MHPKRHKTIQKDVRALEAADVDNRPVDLIFFDVGAQVDGGHAGIKSGCMLGPAKELCPICACVE